MKQNKLLNKLVEHKKLPQHITPLFEIKKTERLWHFPVLAGVCIGLCLFIGWYFNKMQYGTLSSVGALSILYFTHASLSKRMIHIVVCSFGISFSFAFGSVMAFSQISSVLALVFIAFLSHLVTGYFEVSPPGNFFFIMVCSLAINIPFNINTIPTDVGLVVMGAMLSVLLAFLYSVFVAKKEFETLPRIIRRKKRYTKVVESLIIAVACGLDLTIGYLMKIKNPYWICVATIAVLQGKNLRHTSHRNFQRIIGTFVGLGLTWLLLMFVKPASLGIVVAITFLQIVTEFLVVRNYMLAAIL